MAIDTFLHAKWCVAHQDIREGLDLDNDKDLVWYISEVMKRRATKKATGSLLSGPNAACNVYSEGKCRLGSNCWLFDSKLKDSRGI